MVVLTWKFEVLAYTPLSISLLLSSILPHSQRFPLSFPLPSLHPFAPLLYFFPLSSTFTCLPLSPSFLSHIDWHRRGCTNKKAFKPSSAKTCWPKSTGQSGPACGGAVSHRTTVWCVSVIINTHVEGGTVSFPDPLAVLKGDLGMRLRVGLLVVFMYKSFAYRISGCVDYLSQRCMYIYLHVHLRYSRGQIKKFSSMKCPVPNHLFWMIADSAITGFVVFDTAYLHSSSYRCRLNITYPRIMKNLPEALQEGWAGLGDDRSITNCISSSRAAIDMGWGLPIRETVALKHITSLHIQ